MRKIPAFAICLLTFSALYTIFALRIPTRQIRWDPGGSFIPIWIGFIMIALSLIYLVKNLKAGPTKSLFNSWRLLLGLIITTMIYIVFLRYDFPMASFAYTFIVTKMVVSNYGMKISTVLALIINAIFVFSICIAFWFLRVEFPTMLPF